MDISVVWFKRDLRIRDHLPLKLAIDAQIPILLLYVFEPELMDYPDADLRHWRFVHESLRDIQQQLGTEHALNIVFQSVEVLFETLNSQYNIRGVYSYQETGNNVSFQRDKRMKIFFKNHTIPWYEFQHKGYKQIFPSWTRSVLSPPSTVTRVCRLLALVPCSPCPTFTSPLMDTYGASP